MTKYDHILINVELDSRNHGNLERKLNEGYEIIHTFQSTNKLFFLVRKIIKKQDE